MPNFMSMLLTPEFFFSILRISAPIIFATLAAIVVEKAGFCNIGIEGLMMFSALSGSLVSYYAGSWFWGLLAALVVGVLMSLIMGFFAFQMKTDIVLVGIAQSHVDQTIDLNVGRLRHTACHHCTEHRCRKKISLHFSLLFRHRRRILVRCAVDWKSFRGSYQVFSLPAFVPAIRPYTKQSSKALPPTRLVPWMPPAISPAA